MAHFETPRGTRFQIGILILMGLFLGLGNRAFAQDKQAKEEPVKQTVPLSGAGMFKDLLCGMPRQDAKGDGPAASALKHAPANLTTLAKRHDDSRTSMYKRCCGTA
jgi:hypothetical protein